MTLIVTAFFNGDFVLAVDRQESCSYEIVEDLYKGLKDGLILHDEYEECFSYVNKIVITDKCIFTGTGNADILQDLKAYFSFVSDIDLETNEVLKQEYNKIVNRIFEYSEIEDFLKYIFKVYNEKSKYVSRDFNLVYIKLDSEKLVHKLIENKGA